MSRARGRGTVSKQRRPTRRDGEVLEAAVKVFYERGYSDATVQDVSDELGILKGSLYHYIETKEDLLFRVVEEVHADVERIVEETVELQGVNALERLGAYVREIVKYNLQNLKRISIYYHDMDRLSPERYASMRQRRRDHADFVARLIDEAQKAGLADSSTDPSLLANFVFGTVNWTYRWFRAGRGIDHEAVAAACEAFVLRGLVGPGSGETGSGGPPPS
jgi:TetR/AcrR family transcriptional regulator, cholesterol catabolism regulator